MSSQNLYVVFWADLFHKISRKTSLAIATAPNGEAFLRRINRLFRVLRGPWSQSKFGRIIQDARKHLIELLEKGEGDELIEMYMAGCCRDQGKDEGEFGHSELLNALRAKKGRKKFDSVNNWIVKGQLKFSHC